MLIRNNYKGCSRLLWEVENFDQEAPEATFYFQGELYLLEFDGCVDELIQENLKDLFTPNATDIAELYEAIPFICDSSDRLSAGEKLHFRLSTGQPWEAVEHNSTRGKRVVMRSGFGQTATLLKNENNRVSRIILRTEGRGIAHEIKAETTSSGRFRATAEAVTVFHP